MTGKTTENLSDKQKLKAALKEIKELKKEIERKDTMIAFIKKLQALRKF